MCWANLQNTHFSGLTRKNPVFERSVLKYVSIKNRILTPSGQESRVCVNQSDMPRMFSGQSPSRGHAPSQRQAAQTRPHHQA